MRLHLVLLAGALGLVACNSDDTKPSAPPSFVGAGGSSGASAGGSGGLLPDASAGQGGSDASSGGTAGAAGGLDAGDEADVQTDALLDANADIDDAALQQDALDEYELMDVQIKESGPNLACEQPQSWWLSVAQFDKVVTPNKFANAMDALATSVLQHWLTIAEQLDGATWSMTTSGTIDNGSFQQHFPPEYQPSMTGLVRQPSKISSAAAQSLGWLHVVDATPSDVWIEMVQIETSAEYDDASCQTLKTGVITAVIPESQGILPIKTSTATTVGGLLGSPTSTNPPGWSIKLTFTAEHVELSWK